MNQLLFVGILAVLGVQVMAKDEYKVEAYDCSQPMNIKMFDREAHCRFNPESAREGYNSPTREYADGGRIQMSGILPSQYVLLRHVQLFKTYFEC